VRAIRHIRHLLTLDLAQTLACSLILSRIYYCNSVLHGAPFGTIQTLQRVQNNAARIVLQAPRRSDVNSLLQTLHWLPVKQRINYKLAVLTFNRLKFHLARLDSTRHIRRVEPMHFGCVELVEEHSSTRSTRRARLARHVELEPVSTGSTRRARQALLAT